MRYTIRAILFLVFLPGLLPAQTFTKVTGSVVSNDGGDSRAVTWIDYDNDGDPDLFITNGPSAGQNNFLYENNGDGTFTKITSAVIANDNGKSDGCSWGDFNNDGNTDLCVVNWYGQNNFLYQNMGMNVFAFLNTSVVSSDGGRSETCSWGDYNNDGLIDLYVSNSAGTRENFLYRNNGGGSFVKIDTGIIVSETDSTRGVNWVDYDNDGDIDLFLCNENNQDNDLYENTGGGNFVKITTGDIVNDGGASWSGSWGDIDNDGDLDVLIANWGNQNNFLYLNNGDKTFTRVTNGPLVQTPGYSATSSLGDYDNDGDLDVFITSAYGGAQLKNSLYKNLLIENGSLSFEKITTGDIVNDIGWTYGNAWGDYDKDGDLDMCIAKVTGSGSNNNVLYRNDEAPGNNRVSMKCKGVTSNQSGIGTIVKVKSVINGNSVWQTREVTGQAGYCSQNLEVHFGLGNSAVIDSVIVKWSSGTVDSYVNIQVNEFYDLIEGQSIVIGINQVGTELPGDYALHQNYPNPFNPVTLIRYEVPVAGSVKLKAFDIQGREVAELVKGRYQPGVYEVSFDGSFLSSGVYFYKIEAENFSESRKMLLVK